MKNNSKIQTVRRIIQIFFIVFVSIIVLLRHLSEKGVSLPFRVSEFHGICPFGAAAAFGRFISQGKFIPETQPSNFWIFLGVIIVTVLFGKVFCGWFCPLGSVQEMIYSSGKQLRKISARLIPEKNRKSIKTRWLLRLSDRILSFAKYFILIIIMVQTTRKVTLMFGKIDPFYALFNFWTGDVMLPAIIVLSAVILLSVFIYRPWCRWFCPLGAILGIVQIISPRKIRRNTDKCLNCGLCSRVCPEHIAVSEKKSVYNTECIKCGKCIEICPADGALDDCLTIEDKKHYTADISEEKKSSTISGRKKPLVSMKTYTPLIFVMVFFIPVIYGKYFSGFYYIDDFSSNESAVESVSENTDAVMIKSSMTLRDLSGILEISSAELTGYLEISSDIDINTKLRDIEDSEPDVTFKFVKQKAADYLSGDKSTNN